MNKRKLRDYAAGVIAIAGICAAPNTLAVCPSWTSWTKVSFVEVGDGGNYYIFPDLTLGAAVDPCGCKHANGSLAYYRIESPLTDATKQQLGLAYLAKASNKRIQLYASSCVAPGPGSGYALWSLVLGE